MISIAYLMIPLHPLQRLGYLKRTISLHSKILFFVYVTKNLKKKKKKLSTFVPNSKSGTFTSLLESHLYILNY